MLLGTRVHLHLAGVRRRFRAQVAGSLSGLSLHHFLGLHCAVCVGALQAKPGRQAPARRAAAGACLCVPLLKHPGRDRHIVVCEGHPAHIREVDETARCVCTSCRTPFNSFLTIHGTCCGLRADRRTTHPPPLSQQKRKVSGAPKISSQHSASAASLRSLRLAPAHRLARH